MNGLIRNSYKNDRHIARVSAIRERDCKTIIFVDSEVFKHPNYVAKLIPGSKLIVIDSERDGIEQITEVFQEYNNIQSVQIIASVNNNKDSLKLGLTQLNINTLKAHTDDLQQWKNALTDAAEILIFSSLVLSESLFQNFVSQLARIMSADIGAIVTIPGYSQDDNAENDLYSLIVAWQ